MIVETTKLLDVFVLTPKRYYDSRGFFSESWNQRALLHAGCVLPAFVQDNHSFSIDPGTVRGLHFQSPPWSQGKLVRCGRGALFDVAVDIRKGSPTYGSWFGLELSFENGKQLWIPSGFLHGFISLLPDTEIVYKCTNHYAPECDGVVRWDSCGIKWPLDGITLVISEKDEQAQTLAEFDSPFFFEEAQ